ncbi:MAG: ubiquinol-cytochrome c reductase iron-sulfur subunit [Spirochaetota bacterium]
MNDKRFTRRNFLHRAIHVAAAGLVFPLIAGMGNSEEEKEKTQTNENSEVGLDLINEKYSVLGNPGGAVYIQVEGEGMPVIVHRISEDEVAAFSSRCTHAGCKVELPENGEIVCPCHRSRFDAEGKVISGPADKDLKQFSAQIEGSTIIITRR